MDLNYIEEYWFNPFEKYKEEEMSNLFNMFKCPDDAYLDFPCSKCGSDVGHLINCPDGSAFSGDRKTIKNNPLEEGCKDEKEYEEFKARHWERYRLIPDWALKEFWLESRRLLNIRIARYGKNWQAEYGIKLYLDPADPELYKLIEEKPCVTCKFARKCPKCDEELDFDIVDIGVGTMQGNYRCNACGWSDQDTSYLKGGKDG